LSKDSLIKGTIILTLAAFIARFLGVIQRVPLQRLLEDTGMATYGIAYNLYFALLIIATAGIPSALSKLISERTALGQFTEAARIYRAAVWFAVLAGFIITLVLWFGADYYASHISRDPDAALAIRALAPAMLLFPLIAIMRGYFLGKQIMLASGLSQIVEQIMRVSAAVALAYLLLKWGYSKEWAIAGASFGGVAGSVGAFAVMLYFWFKQKKQDLSEQQTLPYRDVDKDQVKDPLPIRQVYAMIFKLSIPISLISIAVPLIYLIDSSTVIALLDNRIGYDKAKETLGILTGRAQSLAGIPPILAIAVSQSIVPIISSAYAQSNMIRVNGQASQALRMSVVLCLPIVLLLCIAARPVNGLLFGDTQGTAIIILLVIGALFQVMMMISGAILMGLGQTRAPMIYVFIGIAVKLAGSFLLAGWIGIYGIIIATSLCFIVIMLLNLRTLKKTVSYVIMGPRWFGLSLTALITISIGLGVERLAHAYIQLPIGFMTYGVHAALLGLLVLFIYPLLLFKFRVVTADDAASLPRPLRKGFEKAAALLRIAES
jgi:stage V sporulation protein B